MKCPHCGEENREIARFCQFCGGLLNPQAADMPIAETDMETEIVSEQADVSFEQEADILQADDESVAFPVDTVEPETDQVLPDQVEPIVEEQVGLEEPGEVEVLSSEQEACEPVESPEPTSDLEACAANQMTELTAPPQQEEFEMIEALEEIPDESEAQADDLFFREGEAKMAVLQVGSVVDGRYLIGEVLSSTGNEVLYRVRDMCRCRQCGYDQNHPDQAFCSNCGAVLDQKPVALMLTRPVDRQNEPVEAHVERQFTEGGLACWVWQESKSQPSATTETPQRMRLIVGQKSDVGRQRDLDEDSMFTLVMEGTYESVPHQVGLFVVADGMGGHEGGEVASKLAVHTFAGELLNRIFSFELVGYALSAQEIQKLMIAALQEANEEVYLERQKRKTDMGTTFTAVLLKDWTAYLAHVGDCRAFRWGEKGLEQLTTDHSIIASMVASGAAQPEEIYTHPRRNVIYRSVGDQPAVEVDVSTCEFAPGDRLVICCDGLWEMIRNEGIADVLMRQPDPQLACEEMVELANAAGGDDNISVIVVQL